MVGMPLVTAFAEFQHHSGDSGAAGSLDAGPASRGRSKVTTHCG